MELKRKLSKYTRIYVAGTIANGTIANAAGTIANGAKKKASFELTLTGYTLATRIYAA